MIRIFDSLKLFDSNLSSRDIRFWPAPTRDMTQMENMGTAHGIYHDFAAN